MIRRSIVRRLNRLPGFDYSKAGWYFITICTKGHIEHFGVIETGNMKLSDIGKIVRARWLEIPEHYANVKIDRFVIMPNHIHGIITIEENNNEDGPINVGTEHCSVPTRKDIEVGSAKTNRYGLLSKIVKSFKNVVTREVRRCLPAVEFGWQRSYYDHVIRNENSMNDIIKYIMQNPAKWAIDEYNAALVNFLRQDKSSGGAQR